jgi:hypothetical protein
VLDVYLMSMVKRPVGLEKTLYVHRYAACFAPVHGKRIKKAEKTRKKLPSSPSSSPQAFLLFADVLVHTGEGGEQW